jgi:AbrB family looped-hinge helix DNA binding protein
MPSATLTSKGQLTIPVEVREALGLKTGDKIDFFESEDGTYSIQPKTGSLMEMHGILAKYSRAKSRKAPSVEEMDEAILDAVADDYRHSIKTDSDVREKAS